MNRWIFNLAGHFIFFSILVFAPAVAKPTGYLQAKQAFESTTSVDERLKLQVSIIAAGYANAMPNEHFNLRLFEAIESFQAEQGYRPDGIVTPAQKQRLQNLAAPLLNLWGFQNVTHPSRQVAIWVPVGLGMPVTQNKFGLAYDDPQKRVRIDFTTVPNLAISDNFNGLLDGLARNNATINYKVLKDGWLVISASTPNGVDWYLRYHQDGPNVTGFTIQWNNANGNISAERIAVLMSASLWSRMTGAAMVEPPPTRAVSLTPGPPQTFAPSTNAPPPAESPRMSSGAGFFVSANGEFITNAHVVKSCATAQAKTEDGSVADARVVARDAANDLALLKLGKTGKAATLRLGVRLGESVAAFGFPHSDLLATTGNFTIGNVTALAGIGDDSRYLQISAPVQAGNSGGPLLDQNGNLVGVVSLKLNALKVATQSGDLPQNVNFAVKASILAAFLEENSVAYQTPPSDQKPLPPADIADIAKAMSLFVTCQSPR